MVAFIGEACAHAARIGTVIGFSESKATQPFTRSKFWQILHALLFAAIFVNGIHHQRTLYRRGRTNAAVAALKFLHHQSVRYVVEATATVFNGDSWTVTAQLTQLFNNMFWKFCAL